MKPLNKEFIVELKKISPPCPTREKTWCLLHQSEANAQDNAGFTSRALRRYVT